MLEKDNVNGKDIGKEIIFLESTTSTNDAASEIGQKMEDPHGIVVVSDTQSHGRGRLGRAWISPPGVNLYFTVLMKPPFLPTDAPLLTLMTAVAVATAVREHTGLKAEIKWPNDIYINSRKTGGILIEMKASMNRITLLSIGVGLNVNMPLDQLPEDIRPLSTSLIREKGEPVDRGKLLEMILKELATRYKILLNGNKRALINDWVRLNCTLGHKIIAKQVDNVISGIAEDINDNGELIVRVPSGEVEVLNSGEVTLLKNTLNP